MSKKSQANKSNVTVRYTGELATPIYEPVSAAGEGPGESEAEVEQRILEQRLLKLGKLFDWYAIDRDGPDALRRLAVELALAHVPGMQVHHELPKRRGRKRTWKDGLGVELVHDVDVLQQMKKMNNEQAIAELRKNKEKPWRAYTLSNLITRHREARRVEENRRHMVEQLMASPLSELGAKYGMATVFGMGATDGKSSDQN